VKNNNIEKEKAKIVEYLRLLIFYFWLGGMKEMARKQEQ
jgi:hypothetical protein